MASNELDKDNFGEFVTIAMRMLEYSQSIHFCNARL